MNDVPLATFQKAIRATHSAEAKLASRVAVHEQFQGETVWQGEVLIFDLEGHPTAFRHYICEINP